MKNSATLVYNLVLAVGDFLALLLAFVGAYILRVSISDRAVSNPIQARTYLGIFVVLLPFWLIIFALIGLYNSNIYEKRFQEIGRLFVGSFIGTLFVVFWNFLASKPIVPAKLVPIYGFTLSFIFLVIIRNLARFIRTKLFEYKVGLTNILIVGNTKLGEELVASLIDSRHSGYRVVGVVGDKHHLSQLYPSLKVFKSFDDATKAIGAENIYTIVQTELYADEERNREVLEFAQTHHIGYRFSPGNSELFVGNLDVDLFRSTIPIITVHQTALFGWGRIAKRLVDIFVSGLMLLLLSPLLVLIAIFIKIFDPGPVFFRSKRLTRYGNEVKMLKFRTMKTKYSGRDPETVFKELGKPELVEEYHKNRAKVANDPRVSRIGRFLRSKSLDELPQLLDVFRGSISLVGPRSIPKEELAYFKDKGPLVLNVKTGITGLAQVSGRSNLSIDERIKLDLYYVQNWSLWLDFTILVKTIRAVLSGFGAK